MLTLLLLAVACKEEYTPKPRGYFQLDLPQKSYKTFSNEVCPCTFEYPSYAAIEQETHFFDEKPEHPCWVNINFPDFNATIYLSYKDIRDRTYFEKVIADSYKLTFKHSQKADFIDEAPIENPAQHVFGYQFDVGGDAASGSQFFVTDSIKHYIRGALYFRSTPNADSLQPAMEFLKKDMDHMIRTLKWK